MGWSDEQLEAMNYSGGSVIVSAAAGSGKTAVLVERVKRIIMDKENPVNADEIVLVTFTQKAAEELKVRLDKSLAEAEEKNGGDEYLRSQRIKLDDADISTISSFCMRLLREYSSAVDLSPDFGVLDESESAVMIDRTVSDVLEEFYKNGEKDTKALLYEWYGGESDLALERSVKYIFNFMRKLPDREKSLAQWLDVYENPDKYYDSIKKEIAERYLIPALAEMKKAGENLIGEFDEKAEPFIESVKEVIEKAEAYINGTEDDLKRLAELIPPTFNSRGMKGDLEPLKEAREVMKKTLPTLIERAGLIVNLKDHYSRTYPVLKALIGLSKAVDAEYSSRKRLKNKIDFSDAELLVIELLRDEEIALNIRNSISVIIVDEFQDSNDLQYEIFCRLSRNMNNLFFVGDIKQSIYHFRGANPRVFNRVIEEAHKEGSPFKHIVLNQNFRSSDKVINAVNYIFEGTMTKKVGEVDYNEEHKLTQGKTYDSDKSHIAELIRFSGGNVKEIRKSEAGYIAERIKEMVESGFLVTEGETKRPCRYGDFAVLMGKYKTNAFIYKKAFDERNISYVAKEDGVFTDYYEIKLILSFLKIIDNPYRNADMAAVLMLPPYNFTPDELSEIKYARTDEIEYPNRFLYTGLNAYASVNPKAAEFMADLKSFREFSREHSPEQLMRKIYDESKIVSVILAMFDGDKRDSNIKRLISYAKKYSENGLKGLSDFIEYMDNLVRSDINTAQAENAEITGNSVQIMTVHGSKGLEFPICFISNLSTGVGRTVDTSLRDPSHKYSFSHAGKIVADIDKGIGLQVVDRKNNLIEDTYPFISIKSDISEQEESEEMRLLYVALTRAKEKLIITAPVKNPDKIGGHLKWISNSKAASAVVKNKDGTDEKVLDIKPTFMNYKPEIGKDENSGNKPKISIRLAEKYPYENITRYRAKVTATQVGVKSVDDFAQTTDHVDRFLKSFSFMNDGGEKALSGKKKGDAYHKVMELIDFSGDASQVECLYEKGMITEAERDCIDIGQIEAFLNSGLCRRIINAERVEKEFPIFCQYTPEDFPEDEEKPFVQGIADLFFVEGGELVLVDYKTNRGVTEKDLIEEYTGQLKIYSEALEKTTTIKVKECYLYSFTLNREIKVKI